MSKLIKNSLGYDSNLFVYQDKTMFNYSIDTILLANFATVNSKVCNVLEVGTNNGALSIFLSERWEKLKIDAIEIQPKAIEIAKKNIKLNNKMMQINLILDDFKLYVQKLIAKQKVKKYDLIICNPPFYKINTGKRRKGSVELYEATHEVNLTLDELICNAKKIIKQKGYLALVLPTERFIDCVVSMRKNDFEIKKVQFIHPRENQKSNLVLIEGRYQVGWGTHFLPNIYLHTNNLLVHEYRNEIKKLYKPLKFDKEKK